MTDAEHVALLSRLRAEPAETEWLEFKRDWYPPEVVGQYLSALSNSAYLKGKSHGYLVFGVDDATHEVVGTTLDPETKKAKGNQPLLIWLNTLLQPRVGLEVHVMELPTGRVVLFEVSAAPMRPVLFDGVAWVRVGSSKTALSQHPEKERAIWTRRLDWSAQICERARLDDLDPNAVVKARLEFAKKHKDQAGQLAAWDDVTFLNKARLTIQGAVTNAAVLLLGRPEASALLVPSVARLSWVLKDDGNRELDYEHFGPPFILNVDRVLARLRNLTIRALPDGTLFPIELSQYDPWVIREALHNCIAHQDYGLAARVNIVESPSAIRLTNAGTFLPGDVESVIRQDAPQEIYRNPFLAEAMVGLNMIDTQGGGIKRMFQTQARRFFPLPDYDLSQPYRVVVTVRGTILDEQYCRLLMERSDLDLDLIILLDKVQKRVSITREQHRLLRRAGLVEGRFPTVMISGPVARLAGQPARHIRERGLERRYYLDMVATLVAEHGPVSRSEIDRLLMDKLPDILTPAQKRNRIHNILSVLSQEHRIRNAGSRPKPKWVAGEGAPTKSIKRESKMSQG